MIERPGENEYPEYYRDYVNMVPEINVLEFMEHQIIRIENALSFLSEEDGAFAYEKGKWSIKEVLGHLIDTERILGERALRFARGEEQDIPQYDENKYVENANFNEQLLDNLLEQLKLARLSNMFLFDSFNEEILERTGMSGGKKFSVRAFPYILAGHAEHHLNVLKGKYLSAFK